MRQVGTVTPNRPTQNAGRGGENREGGRQRRTATLIRADWPKRAYGTDDVPPGSREKAYSNRGLSARGSR